MATRVGLHGGLQSFMSKAQGGSWSSGFWSGSLGTLFGQYTQTKSYGFNVAANAAAGGVISQVTGGKFANGAIMAAYRYMFNDWLHRTSDFFAGFGDTVSFGLTSKIRDWMWEEDGYYLDEDSGFYTAGEVAGVGASVATGWTAGLYGGARSVFWSGYRQGAKEFAQPLGVTIEKTLIGRYANDRIKSDMFWKVASWTFVRNARGSVQAVIRAEGNVWTTIEKPYLMKNYIEIIYR